MRKFISILLVISMVFGLVPVPFAGVKKASASIDFAGGSGTESSPWIITTPEHLNKVRDNLTAHYRLGADIDISGINWEPIGSDSI